MRGLLRWLPAAAAAVGLILVVVGVLGFMSASDDDDRTKEIAALRGEVRAQEREARADERQLKKAVEQLSESVDVVNMEGADVILKVSDIQGALSAAVDLDNAGNRSAAVQGYQAQAAAILELRAKLEDERTALEDARAALAKLEQEAA